MTKQQAKKKILEIADMREMELEDFSRKLFIAKEGMNEQVFNLLFKAVDLQREHLNKIGTDAAMVISSELTSGEIGL